MADLSVDIALLAVSETYVMTAEEALKAAKRIKPHIAIPMHYNSHLRPKDLRETPKSMSN